MTEKEKRKNKAKEKHLMERQIGREENKMVNDNELSIKHRWINLAGKRGDNTIVPARFSLESLYLIDVRSMTLILNVSRKFVPVGTSYKHYFIPQEDVEDTNSLNTKTFNKNKWDQKKFKDVGKTMAFLCYDQKTF